MGMAQDPEEKVLLTTMHWIVQPHFQDNSTDLHLEGSSHSAQGAREQTGWVPYPPHLWDQE